MTDLSCDAVEKNDMVSTKDCESMATGKKVQLTWLGRLEIPVRE